jgi:hypothetical protein
MAVFGTPTIFGHGPEPDDEATLVARDAVRHVDVGATRRASCVIPGMAARERPEMAGTFDLIGWRTITRVAVDRTGALHPYPADGRRSDTGFTPVVDELGELISYARSSELPGRQLVIAGHGVATTDDEWREQIVTDTVELLVDARRPRRPVVGYLHDTGIDGYEGPKGFTTQRGLIARDRTPKPSAEWLRDRLT